MKQCVFPTKANKVRRNPGGKFPSGQFLFFAKRPVFVQKEIYREAQNIVDDRHRFLGDPENMDPQKGEEAAQSDACNTVDHIDLKERFLPGRSGSAEYIAPVKEECPGHAKDEAE